MRTITNIVVYHFVCDLRDADYVGYTARHLFQRVAEHKNSAIGKRLYEAHGGRDHLHESYFKILTRSQGKFDCLVFEMLYIKKFKPNIFKSYYVIKQRFVASFDRQMLF